MVVIIPEFGIQIDNKLKNIYDGNNFSFDKMSYDQ